MMLYALSTVCRFGLTRLDVLTATEFEGDSVPQYQDYPGSRVSFIRELAIWLSANCRGNW
jgi:hypothetical protein